MELLVQHNWEQKSASFINPYVNERNFIENEKQLLLSSMTFWKLREHLKNITLNFLEMKNNQAKLKAFLHYNSSVTFDSLFSAHLCIFCFYFMEKKLDF